MQLISRAWPEALSARAGEAKELSRLLGEDHDLAVLLALSHRRPTGQPDARGRSRHHRPVPILPGRDQGAAEPRGARLFAEPAEELRRRIEAYWSSACRLAECSPPEERPRLPQALDRRAPHTSPQGAGGLTA